MSRVRKSGIHQKDTKLAVVKTLTSFDFRSQNPNFESIKGPLKMSTEDPNSLFNIAVATIFAREFLEASLIIGNYRTAIIRCDHTSEEDKKAKLKNVTIAAAFAALVATLVILAVAIPLGIASSELDENVVRVIEGVSKVVAAICVLQLSLKIPIWLGCYAKVPLLPCKKKMTAWGNGSLQEKPLKNKDLSTISMKEIRFNVAWNIWREVAECGVFLIPFFIGNTAKSIPISALAGIAIALVMGGLIYYANFKFKNKSYLAFFMASVMLFLSVGLFVGGLHEFEEVWGETSDVWVISDPFWSSKQLPMALLKPFGYSSSRTVLQMCSFWLWLAFGCLLHYFKWRNTKLARANATDDYDAEFEAGEQDEEKAVDATKADASLDDDVEQQERPRDESEA